VFSEYQKSAEIGGQELNRMEAGFVRDAMVQELASLPPAALKPLLARHLGSVILILADGHASSETPAAILAQENGAALHWRFRPKP